MGSDISNEGLLQIAETVLTGEQLNELRAELELIKQLQELRIAKNIQGE